MQLTIVFVIDWSVDYSLDQTINRLVYKMSIPASQSLRKYILLSRIKDIHLQQFPLGYYWWHQPFSLRIKVSNKCCCLLCIETNTWSHKYAVYECVSFHIITLILLLHFSSFQFRWEYRDRRGHQEILLQSWNQKHTGSTAVWDVQC